jgi:FtsZ-binding cell division protein ZapB
LSIEYLSELEKKVDVVIKNLEHLKQENAQLKESAQKKTDELERIKDENGSLRNELEKIKSNTQEHQNKLLAATDKIKSMIAKIDAA